MRFGLATAALTAACVISLTACSGKTNLNPRPEGTLPSAFGLPAPMELINLKGYPRESSLLESDLGKAGGDYVLDLPNQNVVANGTNLEINPSFTPPSSAPSGLAYGIYTFFGLGGYDREEKVGLGWTVSPAAGSIWVGLANWEANRWDWFPLDASNNAPIAPSPGGPLASYINGGGELYLAVVATGTAPSTLASLRLGTYAPVAKIIVTPAGGLAPLDVSFSAAQSFDPDGSIVKYEWNFNGDWFYDLDSGGVSTAQHTYSNAGSRVASVRVTDNLGAIAVASIRINAYSEWNHTFGRNLGDYCNEVVVAGSSVYAAGYVNDNGTGDALLLAYSPGGALLWSKQWDNQDDRYSAIAASATGQTIYTAGSTDLGGVGDKDMLVQAWSLDGELLWTKLFGSSGIDEANAILVSGGDLFVCGSGHFEVGQDYQAVILRLTDQGNLVWARSWGGADSDFCESACLVPKLFNDSSIGLLGRTSSFGAGSTDLLYLQFTQDGDLTTALTWGNSDTQLAGQVCSSLTQGTYACCSDFAEDGGLVLKVNAGTPGFARSLRSGVRFTVFSLAFSGGELAFTGKREDASADRRLVLGRINLDTTDLVCEEITKPGAEQFGNALYTLPDGAFLIGGLLNDAQDVLWQSISVSRVDRTETPWMSVAQEAVEIVPETSTLNIPAEDAVGTADTGGGNYDTHVGIHAL